MSSAVIFGVTAPARVDQGIADRVLDFLLEHDVNHIDVAVSYGDADLWVGPWMDRHRSAFFLATKTSKRAMRALEIDGCTPGPPVTSDSGIFLLSALV